ncbi:MAG: alpha/beta fold hydrolase [Vicinamibacterales bacterium]
MPGIVERGQGTPIVVVPGIQGRWEWMAPTVEALSAHGRAITYSLCDEPSSGFTWAGDRGFENYLSQLDDVLAATHVERPVLVGVSYGGLVAAEYAARHPERIAGVVVASAPPPTWTPDARVRRYLRAPRLLAPAFWLGGPLRAYPELKAAFPRPGERLRFAVAQGLRVVGAPPAAARMARRLDWLQRAAFAVDRPVPVPALVVTGEDALERVVPPRQTAEYLTWLPHATAVTMLHTGHAGTITKAREFAALVGGFIAGLPADRPEARSA